MSEALQVATDVLLALANSRHGPGAHAWPTRLASDANHDHLVTADEARGYFAEEGIPVPGNRLEGAQLEALRTLRAATWALTHPAGEHESARLTRPLRSSARFRVDEAGQFQPVRSGWPGFVAAQLPALLELRRVRTHLKICRNPECGWLYLDRTRNQSRVWCDMAACGNRAKVNRYLRRRAQSQNKVHGSRHSARPRRVPT